MLWLRSHKEIRATTARSNLIILVLAILLIVATFSSVNQYEENISKVVTTTTRTTITNVVTQINVVTTTASLNTDSVIASQYSKEVDASFARHLQNLESLNASQVMEDYLANSSVSFVGEPGQLGGTYIGVTNISLLMNDLLHGVVSLTITNTTVQEKQNPQNTQATVNATFYLAENNDVVYSINATIQDFTTYSYTGGEWLISNETWVFENSVMYASQSSVVYAQNERVDALNVSPDGLYLAVGATRFNQLNGTVFLVSISGGNVLWSFNTPTPISYVEVSTNGSYVLASGTSPLTSEVDSTSSVLYLLNHQGRLLWNLTTDTSFISAALSANGSSVALLYDNSVYHLSLVTNVLWNYTLPDSMIGLMMASDGSSIIVAGSEPTYLKGTSLSAELYCFNSNGELLWNYTVPGEIGDFTMSSSGAYVTAVTFNLYDSGVLYYFAGNGTLLWQRSIYGFNELEMISADGSRVLVGESYQSPRSPIYYPGSLLFGSNGDLLLNYSQYLPAAISQNGSLILLSSAGSNSSQVQLIDFTNNNSSSVQTIGISENLNIPQFDTLSIFPDSNTEWVTAQGVTSPDGSPSCATLTFYNLGENESSIELC